MKYLRYKGEFLSRSAVTWCVEILQEADEAYSTIGVLDFEAAEPLLIEWENKTKEAVICGASATLKIVSPGDRTYEDLYSIEVGSIRMDVYKDNSLYWSGTLDTEFYEEPYESEKGYTVTLTFSDFGVLDRLKYDLAGMYTIYDIVSHSIAKSNISCGGIDDSLISTSITSTGAAMSLSDLRMRSDNFYDEDGEASTLSETIEGILQPLALRMIQRNGKVYIYDLNALYNSAATRVITWDGSSSTMGTDTVYNNVKITWNTYAQSGNLLPDTCWGDTDTSASLMALNDIDGVTTGDATYFSYHYSSDGADWTDATDCGFTLWVSREGENATLVSDDVSFFKIVPQYDGSESEGIAISFRSLSFFYRAGISSPSITQRINGVASTELAGAYASCGAALFKSSEVWIPPVDDSSALLIKVVQELLMDPRFNPFEDASNYNTYDGTANQSDWYTQWEKRGNFVYVPVTIKFQPDGGDTIYCWGNRSVIAQDVDDSPVKTLAGTYGGWDIFVSDDNPNTFGYLAYYNAEDREDTSGVLGWQTNRPAINPHTDDTISILTNAEGGQYIPYPNYGGKGGKIWVEVRAGAWLISDGDVNLSATTVIDNYTLWSKYSWLLMKLPEIEIVNGTQFDQTIDTSDVEYNAEVNSAAKEEISIETICGSSASGVPTARGAYYNASEGNQIKELTRAGRTSQIEDLLIGTLYSQYAARRTTLSGEVVIPTDSLANYTETNQSGKLFMITEDRQDLIADTSDAVFVEFRPDEYDTND